MLPTGISLLAHPWKRGVDVVLVDYPGPTTLHGAESEWRPNDDMVSVSYPLWNVR